MNSTEEEFLRNNGMTIMKTIAKGSYGIVYYAYHQLYKSYFALKKIPEYLFNESEVNCLIAFDDPYKVNLYKYYKFEKSVYLLMEYCPCDLTAIVNTKTQMPKEVMVKYVKDVIMAVKACHDRNIAHCDIKPSNFLVDQYGRIKITDFGLSNIYKENEKSNVFLGTKIFMAPEILNKVEFNPFISDIWALGVTIYYLATKHYPFLSDYDELLNHNIVNAIYKSDDIEDEQLRDVVKRCLERNTALRATLDDLLKMPYFAQIQTTKSLKSIPNMLSATHIPPSVSLGVMKIAAFKTPPAIMKPKIVTKSLSSMINRHMIQPRAKMQGTFDNSTI